MKLHIVAFMLLCLLLCCKKSDDSYVRINENGNNQITQTQMNRRNAFIESPFGISIPFTEDVLEKTFGSPLSYVELLGQEIIGKDSFENMKKYEYEGLTIILRSNGLFDADNSYFIISMISNHFSLKENLRIGSSIEEVIGILGQPDSDNGKMMEYKNRECWYTLYFYYENRVITKILWIRDM